MAKTAEELNIIKEEVETLNKKLAELSEDELKEVSGGFLHSVIGSENFPAPVIETLPRVIDLTDHLE